MLWELLRMAFAFGVTWIFVRGVVAWVQEKPEEDKLAVGVVTWIAGSLVYGLMIGGGCN